MILGMSFWDNMDEIGRWIGLCNWTTVAIIPALLIIEGLVAALLARKKERLDQQKVNTERLGRWIKFLNLSNVLLLPTCLVGIGVFGIWFSDRKELLNNQVQETARKAAEDQKVAFQTERKAALDQKASFEAERKVAQEERLKFEVERKAAQEEKAKFEAERLKDLEEIARLKAATANVTPGRIVAETADGITVIDGNSISWGPPRPTPAVNQLLQEADKAKTPDELLAIGEKIVAQQPKLGLGHLMRGMALVQKGQFKDAEAPLNKALSCGGLSKGHESEACRFLALCAHGQGLNEQSLALFKRAVEVYPENEEAKKAVQLLTGAQKSK